jgi:hypothetical protein
MVRGQHACPPTYKSGKLDYKLSKIKKCWTRGGCHGIYAISFRMSGDHNASAFKVEGGQLCHDEVG